MATQITIVGLGQIGGSVGLALGEDSSGTIRRTGHDRELGTARMAEKMGAVDRVSINLISAVSDADVIILALPIDQVRETITSIAQDLKEGSVILDTSPVKEAVIAWAGELLLTSRYYVGLTPVLNPAYLHSAEYGLDAARADLFVDGMMAIAAPPRTPSDAIKLASDLAYMLKSIPFFVDPAEVDSLMAATHILPQLLAAALLNTTVDRPGWREARKLAGRPYAQVTGPVEYSESPAAIEQAALLGRENTLRLIDGFMAELRDLRSAIADQDKTALQSLLERAHAGRQLWWRKRQQAGWASEETSSPGEAPTTREVFGRFIGLGRGKKKSDK
jgi:prephenate dehydrogenase